MSKICKRCGQGIEDGSKTGRVCVYCDKSTGSYVRIQTIFGKKLGRRIGIPEAKEILEREKLKRKKNK